VLVIVATLTADPAKAAGIDAAVKTLGEAPFGKILLLIAALGIAAYGAYCFAMARFARM
jgi:type IV secretory pathway VirB2 component (pilin)